MQIDGISTAEYFGLSGWKEAGVLFFQNSRVTGGGSDSYVVGTYELTDNACKITLEVTLLKSPETVFTVEGNKLPIVIEGERAGDTFSGSAHRLDKAAFDLPIKLTKQADLE